MADFLLSELRHRPWRAGTLALGILAAAVSFVLLTGSARTSSIQLRGTLTRNFRGAYDILVRPQGSFTPLEREQGLVCDNYLSGIYGGITLRQYRTIEHLPGVEVAAPIANVGTVLLSAFVKVPLSGYLTRARHQLLRIRFPWTGDDGLSRYGGATTYLFYSARRLPAAVQKVDCDGFGGFQQSIPPIQGPFDPDLSTLLTCSWPGARGGFGGPAQTYYAFRFPLQLAAIDPNAEAHLLHLDRAVTSGSYLGERAGARVRKGRPTGVHVPVLASSRVYLGDALGASIERLAIPRGVDVEAMLRAGACSVRILPCPSGAIWGPPPGARKGTTAFSFLRSLPGTPLASRRYGATAVYQATLRQAQLGGPFGSDSYWTSGPIAYTRTASGALRPQQTSNDRSIWLDSFSGANGFFPAPPANQDVQFRSLHEVNGVNQASGANGFIRVPFFDLVGRFDPARLPGFSPLSRVPLETYYPPTLQPADPRTSRLLHGRPLLPSENIGGYIQQPPLLLTTLAALPAFTDPRAFSDVPPRLKRAPISVIRIRVAGVTGPDRLSQERIKTVAQLIHDRTGLAVDITAGSSPTPLTLDLPAGKYGRPALTLREGWVKKGVAVAYLTALDRKDLALFALVLVVCCFFLANGTLAAVRSRRAEIGTLRTLGWPSRAIFAAVLGELLVIGLLAGLAGTGLAALLVRLLSLDFPLWRTLLVLPLAVALTLLAGLGPAWEATRGEPLDAIRPPIAPGRRGHAGRVAALALLSLRRLPLRTSLGAAGLALGVAALTVLLGIERAFQGTLVGTLLGNAISLQVRQADLVAAAITVALAALAVADVLYLNLKERAPELAALRTTGWAEQHIVRLVLLEALALGLLGSLTGLAVGLLVGAVVLGIPAAPLLVAALIASAAGTAAALIAATVPTAQTLHAQPSVVLASE